MLNITIIYRHYKYLNDLCGFLTCYVQYLERNPERGT